MTQEEKNILLKDLCARLPYGVYVDAYSWQKDTPKLLIECVPEYVGEEIVVKGLAGRHSIKEIKPYLRPMSSMTKEELKELNDKYGNIAYFFIQDPPYYYGLQAQHEDIGSIEISEFSEIYDWLNAHYFDYRIVPSTGKTLIESGLAIEAPADMYNL